MSMLETEEEPMAREDQTLTTAQLEALRVRLEEERRRILELLRTPTAASYDERSELEEVAQRTTEQDERVGIADRERALLAEVDGALARIRAGTYGIDEQTGEPIPYDRLALIPWARGAAVDEASPAP
jgi:DnaK suppressor protein